jgi:hypothetical protein
MKKFSVSHSMLVIREDVSFIDFIACNEARTDVECGLKLIAHIYGRTEYREQNLLCMLPSISHQVQALSGLLKRKINVIKKQ